MKSILKILTVGILTITGCTTEQTSRPNVILIMADDMGYECLNSYETTQYKTPVLDKMAAQGIRFTNCYSQPLCTPSRVKIMTGKFNYKNYDFFGHLNNQEMTFGNLMREQGYATCIAGKWQLNGLAYQNQIEDWNDATRPIKFGFDEYSLWQLTKKGGQGGRYANPLIEQNGTVLNLKEEDYGPDIFSNFILDFITRKKDKPFFIYYPMVLVHDPFVATPDSKKWTEKEKRFKNDTTYFKDMVEYTDKTVGRILDKLKTLNLEKNTIVIFTGDNGTHPTIYTNTANGIIQGGKGNTTNAGTRVPLLVKWPDKIYSGEVNEDLISFNDFYATLAELTGVSHETDGKSFLPLLQGEEYTPREHLFVHYDPRWGKNVNRYRNQFVRTKQYKLYPSGEFYNLDTDVLEQYPLQREQLTTEQKIVRTMLETQLKNHPNWE